MMMMMDGSVVEAKIGVGKMGGRKEGNK